MNYGGTIDVFHMAGEEAFVCGANGYVTTEMLLEIERDFLENPGEGFDHGDGIYTFGHRWITAQTGPEGRVEVPAYWDLTFVTHVPVSEDREAKGTE